MLVMSKCNPRFKPLVRLGINNVCTNGSRSKSIRVLGIETSCDDTGCGIVDDTKRILGETLISQSLTHLRNGGINPIIAMELHRDNIDTAVNQTLEKASLDMNEVDAIAVTVKPGLLASLQIGVKYAKYMAKLHNKPLIPIHHMEAHALVARMFHDIAYPFLVLLISGGHCQLAIAKNFDEFMLLGETLDDAPGEALDKAARRMKFRNIPILSKLSGGQAIELAASKATNPDLYKFTVPLLQKRDCNFSFSGLKEALNRELKKKELEENVLGNGVFSGTFDMSAAFQLAVAEHLAHRTERAARLCGIMNLLPHHSKNIVISGGVASNNFIFKSIQKVCTPLGFSVFRPPHQVCTDNGIMIAWNGLEKLQKGQIYPNTFDLRLIEPKASFGSNLISVISNANLSVRITRLNKLYKKYILTFFIATRLTSCPEIKPQPWKLNIYYNS